MRQFNTVFGFELKGMLRNRSLLITTGIMCFIALFITTIPSLAVWFGGESEPDPSIDQQVDEDSFVIVYENDEIKEAIQPYLGEETYDTADDLQQAVINEDVTSGFVIKDFNDYTYLTYDLAMDSFEQMDFEAQLQEINERRLFDQAGIDVDEVYDILDQPISQDVIILGKDAGSGTFIALAIMFVMYILILLYGTNVATSVAREKDSRTMELLITSTKPRTLILGKVAAVGLTGVLQISMIILSVIIGFFLNKTNYPEEILLLIKGSMTLDTIAVYILFSVLGYALYLFIYASLGSLVSKVEDVNKSLAPITFLFVIAYLAATLAMAMPDNPIIKITSFIPFISLFTMPIRYMLTSVPIMSLIASSVIMISTVILFAAISIYIYRFGSLNYGNRLTLKEVIKSFRL